ncbi:MAG TPA: hypothetical protein VGD91_09260 [Trebonia sp.]
MNANERDEITASVAAHAELGSGYDAAVAEGLVERIGEEIDRRIDARLGGGSWPAPPTMAQPVPGSHPPPAAYRGPAVPTPSAPAAASPPPPAPRRPGAVSGVILGLGSMGLAVGATGVVVSHHVGSAAEVIMILLIWAAIAIINVAHSQRIS